MKQRSTVKQVWVEGYAQKGDVAVALIPKAGSQSIQMALGRNQIPAEEALELPVRLAFIRNPIKRLESNFTYFKFLGNEHNTWAVPKQALTSWSSFVDHALEVEDDHWKPQVKLISYEGQIVCNVVHRLERIKEFWKVYFPDNALPHINSLRGVNQVPYRLDDLYDYYAEDLEMWHSSQKNCK